MRKPTTLLLLLFVLISGCANNNSRYQQKYDSTPERLPTESELHDATPRSEPYSRGGNKNYQVRGQSYQVLKTAAGFTETGIASWYGRKFHGHLTSNGEIYDMYAMSAAHKNLPIPSYVKVTNNDNNRSVIVRVNDRGPFHKTRIIDVSYSAAYKLGMLKTGTANVTITAITDFRNDLSTNTSDNTSITTPLSNKSSLPIAIPSNAHSIPDNQQNTGEVTSFAKYIQVFATQNKQQANKLVAEISMEHQTEVKYQESNGIFRVLVGPIINANEITPLLLKIKQSGYPNAFIKQP